MCVFVCVTTCMWRSEDDLWKFFPLVICVPGMELRFPGFVTDALNH